MVPSDRFTATAAPAVAAFTQLGYTTYAPQYDRLDRPPKAAAAGSDRCGMPSPGGLFAWSVGAPCWGT